jgi:aminoglycoside phosphotransferase (APT) family kinase protein
VTYGFGISDELHRRLRGAVPPEAVEWVERETGCRVLAQRPLEGGTSSAIHRLVLDGRDDVVLQRFVLDWISEEPWAVSNEVTVLGLHANTDVPSPLLVAADPAGSLTGVPTVLMTALPGRVVWAPPDVGDWLQSLVDTMIAIHETTTSDAIRAWDPYAPEAVPPPWTRHRWAWERAISVYAGDRPASHRHPGRRARAMAGSTRAVQGGAPRHSRTTDRSCYVLGGRPLVGRSPHPMSLIHRLSD